MNTTVDTTIHVTATSVAKAIPMILVALAAFLENSLVLVAVAKSKALRQLPGNVFIVNLAITDVMGSSLCMPFGFVTVILRGHYVFGHGVCQFQAFLIVTLSNVTFLTLLGYSIFRYIMITSIRQLTISTLWRGAKVYLVFIWLIGMLFAALPLVGWGKYRYFPSFYACTVDWTADKSYSMTIFVVVFFIPQMIMLMAYYKISKFVRHHKKQLNKCRRMNAVENFNSAYNASEHAHYNGFSQFEISSGHTLRQTSALPENTQKVFVQSFEPGTGACTTPSYLSSRNMDDKSTFTLEKIRKSLPETEKVQTNPKQKNRAKTHGKCKPMISLLRVVQQERLVKILLCTVLAFYACWMPFAVASFQQVIGHGGPRPKYFDVTSMWLAFSNALCNPVIYGLLNGQFRKAFRDTLKALCGCCCCSAS